MTDVCLDIETRGLGAGASIASIGMVAIHGPDDETWLNDLEPKMKPSAPAYLFSNSYFYVNVVHEAGFRQDQSTLDWWKTQPDEVKSILRVNAVGVEYALKSVTNWLNLSEVGKVWAWGSHFDIAIIEYAASLCGLPVPWSYRVPRCARSVYHEIKNPKTLEPDWTSPLKHNALIDAWDMGRLLRINGIL